MLNNISNSGDMNSTRWSKTNPVIEVSPPLLLQTQSDLQHSRRGVGTGTDFSQRSTFTSNDLWRNRNGAVCKSTLGQDEGDPSVSDWRTKG